VSFHEHIPSLITSSALPLPLPAERFLVWFFFTGGFFFWSTPIFYSFPKTLFPSPLTSSFVKRPLWVFQIWLCPLFFSPSFATMFSLVSFQNPLTAFSTLLVQPGVAEATRWFSSFSSCFSSKFTLPPSPFNSSFWFILPLGSFFETSPSFPLLGPSPIARRFFSSLLRF